MKANLIGVFLLSIVTVSQPAFSAVERKLLDDAPPHLAIVDITEDIVRAPAVPAEPPPSPGGETVLVTLPFSSLQLSPTLAEYLGLTRTQAKAIQKLMDRERPTTVLLMDELQTISGALRDAIQQTHKNEDEGTSRRLVARQERLLKQVMSANSRLQQRINHVLDPQQRKKLDSFERTSEVTVMEGR